MMDLFASGSTQAMLGAFFPGTLTGYYVERPFYIECPMGGIRYYIEKQIDYESLLRLETFMTSDEPSLDTFDGEGKPVFFEETRSGGVLSFIRKVQEKAAAFALEFLDKDRRPAEIIQEELVFCLLRLADWQEYSPEYFDDWFRTEIFLEKE